MLNNIPLTILVLCCTATTAFAQESSPQAQALFEEAVTDYMAARYEQAALKFRKAYNIQPEATFLYNQAKSLERLGNYELARDIMVRARDQEELPLPSELSSKVPGFLAKVDASIKAKEKTQTPPKPKGSFGFLGWTGVGLGVVGSSLIVWSAVVANDVENSSAMLSDQRDKKLFDQQLDAMNDDKKRANFLLIAGTGTLATGLGLILWDILVEEPSDELKPQATITPNSASLHFSTSW